MYWGLERGERDLVERESLRRPFADTSENQRSLLVRFTTQCSTTTYERQPSVFWAILQRWEDS